LVRWVTAYDRFDCINILLLNFVTLLCFYFAEFLRKGLEEEDISVDGKKFEPHATIMKLSKVPPKKLKINGKHRHSLTLLVIRLALLLQT
jgi:hypothetical protein